MNRWPLSFWQSNGFVALNIVHVYSDGWQEFNSSRYRYLDMARPLLAAGHRVFAPHVDQWFHQSEDIRFHCSRADLIIIQRVLVEESIDHVRAWRGRGKPLVVDFDDAYALLRPEDGNQATVFWYEGKVEVKHQTGISYWKVLDRHPLQQFYEGGRICTGFTMPSRILQADYCWDTPCWFIPNFIWTPPYLKEKALRAKLPHRSDELIIGWGGSMSHINSFKRSGVSEALRRVFLKRRHVKFMLCGDQRILPLLPLPANRIIFKQYVTWQDWPKILGLYDIGIAPLQGRYDSSRSQIKALEFSLMGIPFVAAGCPPYQDWMDEGIGSYIQDGPESESEKRADEWEAKLIDLIDNYDYHAGLMGTKFDYAMTWDASANADNLVKIYEDIIDRG